MKSIKSKLFEDKKVNLNSNGILSVIGGANVNISNYSALSFTNVTYTTGDHDPTGDFLTPDCGDGTDGPRDSRPAGPTEAYNLSSY